MKFQIIALCVFVMVNGGHCALWKRGLADAFVGALSDVGSTLLSEDSMRQGCASVGLYNREKDGGPPRNGGGSLSGKVGEGLARFGNNIFSRSGMETGCIRAGFYDPERNNHPQQKTTQQVIVRQPIQVVGGTTQEVRYVTPAQTTQEVRYVTQPQTVPAKYVVVNGQQYQA